MGIVFYKAGLNKVYAVPWFFLIFEYSTDEVGKAVLTTTYRL
jgi:hypothetical protein